MQGKDEKKIWGRFCLQKQEENLDHQGLYLTNPENSNRLVLAAPDFSPSQIWRWDNNMLVCDTGKVLDIDGHFKAGHGAPVLAWEPHGGENQMFCPLKITCPETEKEYCLIGPLAEQDVQGGRLFLTVPEDGPACLETVESSQLFANDMTDTIETCWKFLFRQIEEKDVKVVQIQEFGPAEIPDKDGTGCGFSVHMRH